ncbi:hypothetical protein GWO62_04665 [Corynebacterium macginleyi]|uniref:hypothetical protein n=2 Tax=Corynebacterium TaxID=1716 RepID=UPI00190DA555|nr:hypothetical protein [Corynebacterium macginleyi]MBK4152473.1 hypothetical protein [Corynebacterium macginleyi]
MKKFGLLSIPLSMALILSAVESPANAQSSMSSVPQTLGATSSLGIPDDEVEQLLTAIDSIPDEVLAEGDEATAEWVQENLISKEKEIVPYIATEVACAGAILWAIGSTLLPVAKIIKIKKAIKALGGVKAAVSQLAKKGFNWPSIQQTGGALRDLGAELIGVAGVSEYCFN